MTIPRWRESIRMKPCQGIFFLAACLFTLMANDSVHGKRILILTPVPSYSHQSVFKTIASALLKRGHEVVLLTSNPFNDPTLTNLTEIDFSHTFPEMRKVIRAFRYGQATQAEMEKVLFDGLKRILYYAFEHPRMKQVYAARDTEKFDAVMVEGVGGPGMFGLAYKFNAPIIGIVSVDLHRFHHFVLAQPLLPSHPSNWEQFTTTGDQLPFWQRVANFLEAWLFMYRWVNTFVRGHNEVARSFFGEDLPCVNDIAKNMSIFLVEQPRTIGIARPTQPNVIFFDSLHIAKTPPPLPKVVKEFLDKATSGFVYMSLGTNMKCEDMTMDSLNIIYDAFSKLPYKVLWKCERDQMPRKLENLLVVKWVPQQGVLAHPNIKLFVYQGGLQSTEETIHYAVPILGIPLFFDQGYRVKKLASLGVAKVLDYDTMTTETFFDTIMEITTDKRYKERMIELSTVTRDRPYDSLDNVVWWIEFVMRHKGAPHLRFSGVDEPWYQHQDMDVVAFIAIVFALIVLLSIGILLYGIKRFRSTVPAVWKNVITLKENVKKRE